MRRELNKRMKALEDSRKPFKSWHVIVQDKGMTEDDAIEAYEAIRGPIRNDDYVLVVITGVR